MYAYTHTTTVSTFVINIVVLWFIFHFQAEQMRVKRELQETALALAMEEKKRQHLSEEEAR